MNPDKDAMRLGAIILAGGRSTRMGRPKDSLPFRGGTLLGHLGATLLGCTEAVVVATRDETQVLPPLPAGVARTHDAAAERGPLEGLAAGMRWLTAARGFGADDVAFVTACDHALLTAAAVRAIADRLGPHDAAVPFVGGVLQPLCAAYRLRVGAAVDRLRGAAGAGPRQLLATIDVNRLDEATLRTFDAALDCLRNVNTPADYDELRRLDR